MSKNIKIWVSSYTKGPGNKLQFHFKTTQSNSKRKLKKFNKIWGPVFLSIFDDPDAFAFDCAILTRKALQKIFYRS